MDRSGGTGAVPLSRRISEYPLHRSGVPEQYLADADQSRCAL